MKNQELMTEIAERLKTGPGLILLHHNADIDAIGSAIALKSAYPTFEIGAFQNISLISKKFLQHFQDITISHDPEVEKFETIVILDTSTPSQLGVAYDLLPFHIVIDHHVPSDIWKTDLYYCDESKTSCAEIIFELLELIDFSISSDVALALLVAILADSGHFKYATKDTFINYGRLLELGNLKPGDVFQILENKNNIEKSQRIAHLKGAQRLRFQEFKGFLIASSILSSYEASMCNHLISLGADVAFVGAQREEQVRISGRASVELVNRGLHLGELFKNLGSELFCEGGGHEGAAGLNGTGDVEMVLNTCMSKVTELLRKL